MKTTRSARGADGLLGRTVADRTRWWFAPPEAMRERDSERSAEILRVTAPRRMTKRGARTGEGGRGYKGSAFTLRRTSRSRLIARATYINAMARAADARLSTRSEANRSPPGVRGHVSAAFDGIPLPCCESRALPNGLFRGGPRRSTVARVVEAGERDWVTRASAGDSACVREARPSRFFALLRRAAPPRRFSRLDALFGVPQPGASSEIDAGVHVLPELEFAAVTGNALPVVR